MCAYYVLYIVDMQIFRADTFLNDVKAVSISYYHQNDHDRY